ncbi:MAG: lytic transglycosylase domain-containing protein [Bacteroidales bacterium]|nr:lytic transglycosylase domain-containing protein [Bacteroidales bacterium]MCF8405317.1 lytic transglycosylase domain-containing protein [Bacteroidales bacterium]
MNKYLLATVLLLISVGIFALFSFSSLDHSNKDNDGNTVHQQDAVITSPPLPKKINFAGEPAPLQLTHVIENLDREILVNTYFHSSTIQMIKRANRWFPVIEPVLAKYNIPDDFKYLALVESGFLNVESPMGAAGFWQFMEKTAREYGMEVNDYVDERYNLELSTEKACEYLQDSFEEYQNWTLVAAAYNAGKRRITQSIEQQKTSDYYDLYLNEETTRYVYRILAIKIILNSPKTYGFDIKPAELYPPQKVYFLEITTPIENLLDFALEHDISYRELKYFNPWLRSNYLKNQSGKLYRIKLPLKK